MPGGAPARMGRVRRTGRAPAAFPLYPNPEASNLNSLVLIRIRLARVRARDPKGRFAKARSGNPRRRPPGIPNPRRRPLGLLLRQARPGTLAPPIERSQGISAAAFEPASSSRAAAASGGLDPDGSMRWIRWAPAPKGSP